MLKNINEKWDRYLDSFIARYITEIMVGIGIAAVVIIIGILTLVTRWAVVSSLDAQLMLIRAEGVEIKRQQAENAKRIVDLEAQQGWLNTKIKIHREDMNR